MIKLYEFIIGGGSINTVERVTQIFIGFYNTLKYCALLPLRFVKALKRGDGEKSFSQLADSLDKEQVGVFNRYFAAFYISVCCRYHESIRRVKVDLGDIPKHPQGWGEAAEKTVYHVGWKLLFDLLSYAPERLVRPFSAMKRFFSFNYARDNLLKSTKDNLAFLRRHLGVIIPSIFAIVIFSYMVSVANTPIVLGAQVNGIELGLIESIDVIDDTVKEVEEKTSSVLGRSFKYPYNISYYFSEKDKYLTKSQLYNSLMDTLGEYIRPGYGLYVDDKLVAATKTENEITKAIEDALTLEQSKNDRFTVEVFSSIRTVTGTFPTQKLLNTEGLTEFLLYGSSEYSLLNVLNRINTPIYGTCSRLGAGFCTSLGKKAYDKAKIAAYNTDFTNTHFYYDDSPNTIPDKMDGTVITFSYYVDITTVGDLPFETVRENDPDIYVGGEEISVKGKNGKAVMTTRYTYVNGEQISKSTVSSQIFASPTAQIVKVGTKPLPEENVNNSLKVFILPRQSSINSYFGWRDMNGDGKNDDFHNGLDIEAPMRSKIYASLSGEVVFAESYSTFGNLIRIKHDNGYETYYAHLDEFCVKKGDRVKQGQLIGYSGNTGYTTGPHFHFELRKPNGTAVNPLSYIYKS